MGEQRACYILPGSLVVVNSYALGTVNFASTRVLSYSGVVGGTLTPINKLDFLAPFLALIGAVANVTTVYIMKRRIYS